MNKYFLYGSFAAFLMLLEGCTTHMVQKEAGGLSARETGKIYATAERNIPKYESESYRLPCWFMQVWNSEKVKVLDAKGTSLNSVVLLPGIYSVRADCMQGTWSAYPEATFRVMAGHTYIIYGLNDRGRVSLHLQHIDE
ncbi:hypothetical protein [Roseateles sp. P5_E7]